MVLWVDKIHYIYICPKFEEDGKAECDIGEAEKRHI